MFLRSHARHHDIYVPDEAHQLRCPSLPSFASHCKKPTPGPLLARRAPEMNPHEVLPYDIWHLIFQQLCSDGGAAGCALARTSRSFRALSASTRFYSLTLASVAQVKGFLICLERIRRSNAPSPRPSSSSDSPGLASAGSGSGTPDPARGTPPIHHLLLSFLPPTCDAPQRAFRKWTDYARGERALVFQLANDHHAWVKGKALWNRECVLHVSRLLQLAAPSLRSLVLLQCAEVRLPLLALLPHGLPVLRELTLLADDRALLRAPGPGALVAGQNDESDFEFYGVPVWAGVGGFAESTAQNTESSADPSVTPNVRPPPLPSLTHLHIVCAGPKLHGWERTLPRWASIAPSLTHLRVSQGTARIPPALAELLGLPPAPSDDGAEPETPLTPNPIAGLERREPPASPTDDARSARATISAASASDLDDVPAPPAPTLDRARTVVVQMCGARKSSAEGARDPALRELQRVVDWLDERRAADGDGDEEAPRLVVLKNRAYMPGYWEARLAWDWRERMRGGGGCWTEDERDEHAWRVFHVPEQGKKRGIVAVNVAEVGAGGQSSFDGADGGESRSKRRWWKVLANGVARARKRGNAT